MLTSIDCCYKCEKRSVSCHSTCDEYIRLSTTRKAELDAIAEQKNQKFISDCLYYRQLRLEQRKRRRERE